MSDAMYAAASLYHDPRYFNKSEERIRLNKIRREREYRKQVTLLTLALVLLLSVVVFGVTAIHSNAENSDYKVEYKYYKNVVVGYGDSLWNIAQDNISYDHYDNVDEYISEVMNINHISDQNTITSGCTLTVPYYSDTYK